MGLARNLFRLLVEDLSENENDIQKTITLLLLD